MKVREMTIEEIKVLLNRKNTEIALLTKNLTSTRGKLATAVEALKEVERSKYGMQFRRDRNPAIAKQALAEIGGVNE